jgi:hypothetical protein
LTAEEGLAAAEGDRKPRSFGYFTAGANISLGIRSRLTDSLKCGLPYEWVDIDIGITTSVSSSSYEEGVKEGFLRMPSSLQ